MSEVAADRSLSSLRVPILFCLWGLITLLMAVGCLYNLSLIIDGPPDFQGYKISRPGYGVVPFNVCAWGLASSLTLGLVILNPFKWLNGKRLILGCFALALLLGALAVVPLSGYLLYAAIPTLIVLPATPIALLISGVIVSLTIALLVFATFAFFVGVPVMLFNQIFAFEKAVNVYRYQARGLAGYIVRAVFWLRNEPLPAAPPDDSKGARFATWPEVSQLHQPAPESMAFGHAGQPLFLKTDKHVLIMASTRSGKGVSLIIPHLLRYKGSAFVLDPKGENAKASGRQRARLNGRVHYLDPFGISGKPQSRFNPLSRFTPENMEAESKALAAAMVVTSEQERTHWTASAQQLIATLILYVYASPEFGPHNKDLPMVRRLLLGNLQPALKDMVNLDVANGLLRDLAMSFVETPEKEFGSIVSSAQRQTEILDNPYLVACLSAEGEAPEVDFKDWQRGTMTVFLCLAAPKFPTFNRWLRLVLTSALDEMTETLNPPKLPVCFMLDELATLGKLPAVENAVGLAAGYGIQLVTVFQDIGQMRDLYRDRWTSIVGNAGVRAVFNLDDFHTADYWSKFVGSRLVAARSRQEDIYGYSQGENVGETMRPLISPDQMMLDFASMPPSSGRPSKMLVLAQGAHPITTDRVPYFKDVSLKGLWDNPLQPTRPKGPAEPPKAPPKTTPAAAAARNGHDAPADPTNDTDGFAASIAEAASKAVKGPQDHAPDQ